MSLGLLSRFDCAVLVSFGLLIFSIRIVEYATREQAQHAVNTLTNQTLMGRQVYVREVRSNFSEPLFVLLKQPIDRIVNLSLVLRDPRPGTLVEVVSAVPAGGSFTLPM